MGFATGRPVACTVELFQQGGPFGSATYPPSVGRTRKSCHSPPAAVTVTRMPPYGRSRDRACRFVALGNRKRIAARAAPSGDPAIGSVGCPCAEFVVVAVTSGRSSRAAGGLAAVAMVARPLAACGSPVDYRQPGSIINSASAAGPEDRPIVSAAAFGGLDERFHVILGWLMVG